MSPLKKRHHRRVVHAVFAESSWERVGDITANRAAGIVGGSRDDVPVPETRSPRSTVCSRRRSTRWTRSRKPAPTWISSHFSPDARTRRAGSTERPFPRWPRWSAAGCSPRRDTTRRPPPWRTCSAGSNARPAAASWLPSSHGTGGAGRRPLPARLPATATMFADGRASLRHVEVIARVLDAPSARRLTPEQWAGAEIRVGGQGPRLHPLGAAGLGCRAGRGARPGRRRARRPAAGAGQRAVT